jgi:hypothetical protein
VPLSAAALGELEAVLAKDAEADAAPVAPGVNVTVNVTGWLVVTVTGNDSPLIENSEGLVPPKPTEVTDTLAPVAVSVPVWVPLVPTTTLPALTGLTLKVPWLCVIPDPLSATLSVGFEAFETIATFPLKLPAEGGVKITLKDALCPGVKVTGVVIPEMPKPVPVTVAREIIALTPPVFFTVSVCDWFWPNVMLVKVRPAGVAVRVAGVTPVPERAMSSDVLDPLTVIESFPLLAPAVGGAKATPNVVLWFGAKVSGSVRPE